LQATTHKVQVVSILPPRFWRQVIGWRYCAVTQDSLSWHDAIRRKRSVCSFFQGKW